MATLFSFFCLANSSRIQATNTWSRGGSSPIRPSRQAAGSNGQGGLAAAIHTHIPTSKFSTAHWTTSSFHGQGGVCERIQCSACSRA
eukprot:scaffold20904_cov95-Isochrysis_galbana.AAC.2